MADTKVIIVDDSDSYRNTLRNVLKNIGNAEVIGEATNGDDFLKLLRNKTPDVVFMDVSMPGMNGIEATRRAIEKNKELVIIGVSIYQDENYIEKLVKAGARGYLWKLSNNMQLFKSIIDHPKADVFFSETIKTKISGQIEASIKTILIVDDFVTNTVVIESALTTSGYFVLKAINAAEGLKIAENPENKIDLFIIDYNMPDMNGAELISEIKKISTYKNVPAIILSSDEDAEKRKKAKQVGATGWMKKPFVLSKFLKIVDNIF